MAKKVRRVRPAATSGGQSKTKTGVEQPQLTSEQQFQQEYAYVIKDLRQVFLLAGVMFVLLIVLNLLLQS
ncbi:MAG: hypothetical protein R3E31_17095 [Chloroflexota bacterium]|nr:hypothetical protein [Anaerolineales bacterium]MCA9977898.1 hypothetical protein [Anaerolineales bacterium]